MTFNDDAQINAGDVSVGGGGGPGMGGRIAVGGGVGGLILLVITLLLGGDPGSVLGNLTGGDQNTQQTQAGSTLDSCKTGADANRDVNCRVVATVNSLNAVWAQQLPQQTRTQYVKPSVKLFSGSVNTGCGNATSDVGPFYCPADQTAYFDTSFFQVLVDRFGSSGGPLAQEYVVAHEIGHHISNQLGTLANAQQGSGPTGGGVRSELQADCYAGVWAYWADKTNAPGGNKPFLQKLTDQDVHDALSAASSVGDDRIQRSAGQRVNPETWTHGSSEERQKWFIAGYKSGQVKTCDTFSSRDLNNP